jgi:hypothetical protein
MNYGLSFLVSIFLIEAFFRRLLGDYYVSDLDFLLFSGVFPDLYSTVIVVPGLAMDVGVP